MLHRPAMGAILTLLLAASCTTGRRSPAGFRLPADGDVERGKAAFVELGCNQCHPLAGADLAPSGGRTQVAIRLGGEVTREPGDGQLVRSIICPPEGRRGTLGMPRYADTLTVRQLTDIVALLQSRYSQRRLSPSWGYY